MSRYKTLTSLILLWLISSASVQAGPEDFSPGPLIEEFGPVAPVVTTRAVKHDTRFHVAFDVANGAEENTLNRTLTSAARFLNLHVANGIPAGNLHLAIVIHGSAVKDVASDSAGVNAPLVSALLEHNVRLIVCGQSAAYYDVSIQSLLPGVEMELSAMTAHALLQHSGYTLNPF